MEPQFKPKTYRAGKDAVSASYENARTQELLRLGKFSLSGGGSIQSDAAGVHLTLPRGLHLVFAQITGVGTGGYANAMSWKEVEPANDGTGDFMDVTNGITGDAAATPPYNPAYTFSGEALDTDTVVALIQSVGRPDTGKVIQEWLVVGSGGGSGGGGNSAIVEITSATEDGDGYQDGEIGANQDGATDAIKVWNFNTGSAALPVGFYHATLLTSAPAGSPSVPVYGLAYTVC